MTGGGTPTALYRLYGPDDALLYRTSERCYPMPVLASPAPVISPETRLSSSVQAGLWQDCTPRETRCDRENITLSYECSPRAVIRDLLPLAGGQQ
jgi:hypothetical protein